MSAAPNRTGWIYGGESIGVVVRIVAPRGFCFVSVDGLDYFLHRGDYRGNFDDLRESTKVRFTAVRTPKGLRACDASRA